MIDSDSSEAPEFGWKVLIHPPYSPDQTPSDYNLSIRNVFAGAKFASRESCEIDSYSLLPVGMRVSKYESVITFKISTIYRTKWCTSDLLFVVK